MTANSFTGVSLDPPLVVVCVDHRTRTHEHLKASGLFGVHILRAGQEELSQRCAGLSGEPGNRIADLAPQISALGIPLLDDCLAALECRVKAAYEGGDHTIFLGEVLSAQSAEGEPLLYFNRAYQQLSGTAE
jgi:flavin reductase (DIM6/NTAB) family NADH-FMN oxidoreductase RutF